MAKDSPSARTKRFFEAQGYLVASTEKINPFAGPPQLKCETCGKNRIGMKKELYGIADHIAFHPDLPEVLLIQSTSATNHAHRRVKILGNEVAYQWLLQPARHIIVMSWSKKAKKKKAKRPEIKKSSGYK